MEVQCPSCVTTIGTLSYLQEARAEFTEMKSRIESLELEVQVNKSVGNGA